MSAFRANLETAANFVTVVAGISIIAFLSATWARNVPRPTSEIPYEEGASVSWPVRNADQSTNTAVILYFNTRCRFCLESVEFYRQLSSDLSAAHSKVDLYVVTDEPVESVAGYFEEHGIVAHRFAHIKEAGLQLSATPTLLVVSPSNKVVGVFVGLLSDSEQQRLRTQLIR